ncbi:MAG: hypothetical protein HC812_00420 [Leptolyngbya sp. RL_3_1]|nr:hypothetical protein [Leptolyngbya sp. RL_3_1]
MMGFAQKLSHPPEPVSPEPPRQARRGQALLGILDLPLLHRRTLTAIIRQGGASTDDLVKQGLENLEVLLPALKALRTDGWLDYDAETQIWRYRNSSDDRG